MTNVITKADLDAALTGGCDANCGHVHDEMFISPRCHPGSQTFAVYDRRNGTVSITCGTCEKPICRVKVADPKPS